MIDDVAGAGVPGHGRRHDPDGPGAGDQYVLADQRERQRGVHGVAERVEDAPPLPGPRRSGAPTRSRGQHHVLGEGAVAADAEADRAAAQVAAPGQAVAALAADQVALAADQLADLDVPDVRADGGDLADELVAEDQRGLTAPCAQPSQEWMCRSVPQMPVRSTLISTSPGPDSGSGRSTSSKPACGPDLKSAFMGLPNCALGSCSARSVPPCGDGRVGQLTPLDPPESISTTEFFSIDELAITVA